jgi:hypothetical protein
LNPQEIYTQNSTEGYINYIDIDRSAGKLYEYGLIGSVDTGTPFVRRTNLDGTGTETIISGGLGTLQYGFALNVHNSQMYIGDHYGLKVANLDGSGLRDYFPVPHVASSRFYPHDIQVDDLNSKLYYTDALNFFGVGRVDLATGTGLNVVLNTGSTGSTHLALDVAHGLLYYSTGNTTLGSGSIGVANLDGSNAHALISPIAAYDIELDPRSNKIYWTTLDSIQSANLDGSGIETLVTLSQPGPWHADSLVLDLTPVPEPSAIVSCLIGMVVSVCLLRREKQTPLDSFSH